MSELIAEQLYKLGLQSKKPYVSSGFITKPMDKEKLQDMKHNNLEVVESNDRQKHLKFANKEKLKQRGYNLYLKQE
jgi:hypothetical protein